MLCEFISRESSMGKVTFKMVFQGWLILSLVEMRQEHNQTKGFCLRRMYKLTDKGSLFHVRLRAQGHWETSRRQNDTSECYYFCLGTTESFCPYFTGHNRSQALADAGAIGRVRILIEDDFSFQRLCHPLGSKEKHHHLN